MKTSLQKVWQNYRATGEGYQTLLRMISVFVYRFPLQSRKCQEEDCAEFYLSFYRRIPHIIQHYREQGKGIEAYLRSCLKWHLKSYLKDKYKELRNREIALTAYRIMEPGCVDQDVYDEEVRESPAPGPRYKPVTLAPSVPAEGVAPLEDKEARKVLLLSVKAAYDLKDPIIEAIASSIGMHRETLFHLIEVTRSVVEEKKARFDLLQEERTKLFLKICSLRQDIDRCTNSLVKEKLARHLSRAYLRYRRIRNRLSHFYLTPSHKKLAEILGIPKGSIDSMIYYLKKELPARN